MWNRKITIYSPHLRNSSISDIGMLGCIIHLNLRNLLPKIGRFLRVHSVFVITCETTIPKIFKTKPYLIHGNAGTKIIKKIVVNDMFVIVSPVTFTVYSFNCIVDTCTVCT
jgi:hypothetical protein